MIVPLEHILILAALLFFLGMGGLLAWRANLIMMLVSIEVMLNAVMLVFVAGSARWGNADGQLFAIFIMALTSAEVSLALKGFDGPSADAEDALKYALRRLGGGS